MASCCRGLCALQIGSGTLEATRVAARDKRDQGLVRYRDSDRGVDDTRWICINVTLVGASIFLAVARGSLTLKDSSPLEFLLHGSPEDLVSIW